MGGKAAQKKMCPAKAGLYEGPNTLPGSRLYRDEFRPPLRKTPRRGVRVTHGAQKIGWRASMPHTLAVLPARFVFNRFLRAES
jgi:hypothetical protein